MYLYIIYCGYNMEFYTQNIYTLLLANVIN